MAQESKRPSGAASRVTAVLLILGLVASACSGTNDGTTRALDGDAAAPADCVPTPDGVTGIGEGRVEDQIEPAGAVGKCPEGFGTGPSPCVDVPDEYELAARWPFDAPGNLGAEVSEHTPYAGALDARGPGSSAHATRTSTNNNNAMGIDFDKDQDFSIHAWVRFDPAEGDVSFAEADPNQRLEQLLPYLVSTRGEPRSFAAAELSAAFDRDARAAKLIGELAEGAEEASPPIAGPVPSADAFDGWVIVEHGFETTDGWLLGIGSDGTVAFFVSYEDDSGNWIYNPYPTPMRPEILDGEWHLIAAAIDRTPEGDALPDTNDSSGNDEGTIYVDNNPVLHFDIGKDLAFDNENDIVIGALEAGDQYWDEWPGLIDEVEIFRTELPEPFIEELYESGPNGRCEPDIIFEEVCDIVVSLTWDSKADGTTIVYEDLDLDVAVAPNAPSLAKPPAGWAFRTPETNQVNWTQLTLSDVISPPLWPEVETHHESLETFGVPLTDTFDIYVDGEVFDGYEPGEPVPYHLEASSKIWTHSFSQGWASKSGPTLTLSRSLIYQEPWAEIDGPFPFTCGAEDSACDADALAVDPDEDAGDDGYSNAEALKPKPCRR